MECENSSMIQIKTDISDVGNTLIKMIYQYSATLNLVNDIYSKIPFGPIRLYILSESDTSFFPLLIDGTCVPSQKLIRIRFKNNDNLMSKINLSSGDDANIILTKLRNIAIWQMFSTFIFELLNLQNISAGVIEELCQKIDNGNHYALAMEKLEQAAFDHHNLCKLGIESYGWNSIVDKYKDAL